MGDGKLATVLERVDAIEPTIRDGAAESEGLGRLAPSVIDALHEADLFRMMVPAEFGGFDLTIPDMVKVVTRVASFDASTGWTLAILADGPLFGRFLSDGAMATICGDPVGLVAGTLNPATAQAERVDGGFRFQRAGDVSLGFVACPVGDGVGHRHDAAGRWCRPRRSRSAPGCSPSTRRGRSTHGM